MTQSSTGRLLCLAVLLLFVLVCGIHLAGVHHDVDGHAIAVGITLLIGSVVMAILATEFVAKTVLIPAVILAPSIMAPNGPRDSLPAGWSLPLRR